MAAIQATVQVFEHVKVGGNSFGVHKAILQSSSDTLTVPTLADRTTPSNSVAELDDGNNDTGVTVSASGANTVTLIGGTRNGVVWFTTRHRGYINYGAEA
jgi:hypothetical protein